MSTAPHLSRLIDDRNATSAIEFAIVLPVFLALLFGMIGFGAYFAVVHGVQQLAAEAARASVAGLSDDERNGLARGYIDRNIASYPLLTPSRLTLERSATDPVTGVFALTLRYDLSDMFIFALPRVVPMPPSTLVRSAAIQRGGY